MTYQLTLHINMDKFIGIISKALSPQRMLYMQELKLEFTKGQDKYMARIWIKNMDLLTQVAAAEDFNSKSAEEVLSFLLAKARPILRSVEITKNGLLNDGPNGEPAKQIFFSQGSHLSERTYLKDGQPNDPPSGVPAHIKFNPNLQDNLNYSKKIRYAIRYADGVTLGEISDIDCTQEQIKDFCDAEKFNAKTKKITNVIGKHFKCG